MCVCIYIMLSAITNFSEEEKHSKFMIENNKDTQLNAQSVLKTGFHN